ncbi:hypothetical protein B0I35DRAFT_62812 [Stachybotrys elegans]|uniref:Zn(2)-C6 fungal-type domain-containing protein n=1 Tax=Stachybotrys elegans TaxID=80388 RepID=A0A8K0SKU2_9HYPO|nr:hypothetical protein B0I35DRAFT_62812 [Stachybotrys elegans]
MISCTECKRRKQRCNQEWPCNHCRARRMVHSCDFQSTTKTQTDARSSHKLPASDAATASITDDGGDVDGMASAELNSLGYGRDDLFCALSLHPCQAMSYKLPGRVQEAFRAVPPKPYADMLVKFFLDNINHHYGTLCQETFLQSYLDWWSHRQANKENPHSSSPHIAFAALILQMCAVAVQLPSQEVQLKLETDMAERLNDISLRCHEAANTLSAFIPPGGPDLSKCSSCS